MQQSPSQMVACKKSPVRYCKSRFWLLIALEEVQFGRVTEIPYVDVEQAPSIRHVF